MVVLVPNSPLPSPTDVACVIKDTSPVEVCEEEKRGICHLLSTEDASQQLLTTREELNYSIISIPGKGTGMVARRRMLPGEIVMDEVPLIILPDEIYQDMEKTETFLDAKINSMSSEQREQFFALTDCRNAEEATYLGIFYTNDMNYEGDAAVCPVMSRANHSCKPNAEFVSRKDLGVQRLVVMYPIEAGQEITISYMAAADEGSDLREVRQQYLRSWYGFQCTCTDCTLQGEEHEENEKVREEIKQLQAVGLEELTAAELEELIDKLYQINGKLSYIMDIVGVLYKSVLFSLAGRDVISRISYGLRGFLLAGIVHGEDSDWAELWCERKWMDEYDAAHLVARWGW